MLKLGMYVRCPYDNEAEKISEARNFFLGQVVDVDEEVEKATVVFHDPLKLRSFFKSVPEKVTYNVKSLARAFALANSNVIFKGRRVKLLSVSRPANKDYDYNDYFVEYFKDGKAEVGEVCETQIEIPFTRTNYNPVYQMNRYELHNPNWYLHRRIVSSSLNIIANAPSGFKNLLGTRVHLFTHQVDTIIRALSESPCRLMLADEVGLGKTIEALAIIKGILDKRPNMCTLIVVPETLVYQWQTELSYKFWFDVPIWGIGDLNDSPILLTSFDSFEKDFAKIANYKKWSMCIVDETHKLLANNSLYGVIFNLCKSTDNVLLLSATPILHREQEYYKLLALLNPTRFENMPIIEFDDLLSKQKNIQDIIFNLMRDLPDYTEYGLQDDFIDGLEQINDEINDTKLKELISKIDGNADDKGLSVVKLALSYIAEFYQIERGIIRHRRAEIEAANIKRELVDVSYEMVGSDRGFFEENCYNNIIDVTTNICSDGKMATVKMLLSAVSSSPYAVLEVLEKCKEQLTKEDVELIMTNLDKWKQAVDSEINRISDVSDDIENFHSKFAKIVDYIDQEDLYCENKFLIFTGFTSTATMLEKCFKRFFGESTTCSFHSGKTVDEMQEAASIFQNESEYRFMICDESGGEGRNFQVADYIIHCDLPWSPAMLEQRIGRLDRIGRDNSRNVVSVVIHSENSLENDLFNVYNQGLNIFNASLCGMEIAFEQIHSRIETALKNDVQYGLSSVVDEIKILAEQMNKEIEKERYFDLARQLDIDLQRKLEKLIIHFTDNDGAELMNTMLAWPQMAGFRGISVSNAFKDGSKVVSIDTTNISEKSMENTLYFPPRMDEIIRRSKYKNDIRGTFSRTAAVKHENLTFFAPYNPLFDSITTNAEECYKGRCVALKYDSCEFDWKGLILTWNIKYNPYMLCKKGLSPDLASLISNFLPSEQVTYSRCTNSMYADITTEQIIEQLEFFKLKRPIHLGKRDNGAIDSFIKMFPPDKWRDYVKLTYSLGKKYVLEQTEYLMEAERAKKELERILTANQAREIFYGYADDNTLIKSNEEIEALVYGLENPLVELDLIAFVVFEK